LRLQSAQGRAADAGAGFLGDFGLVPGTCRVAEAGGAFALGIEVVNDGVLLRRLVEPERLAQPPGDVVVGA
jgi:hypothetical protein